MVNRSRPSQEKRRKEQGRKEKQRQKAERRLEAKTRRATAPPRTPREDPDIAGIVPGPQPPRDD